MLKKIVFAGIGLALLVSPLIASAQSTDVQSVIAALLAQVKALQAQIVQLQGQGRGQFNCMDFSQRPLTLGARDSDGDENVTSLQEYLIAKGYLDAQYKTGYYGFLTVQAVGKMQMDLDILSSANDSAYGIMGPQTRAAIGCNNPTPQPQPQPTPVPISSNFSASPTSGTAPLAVSFSVNSIGISANFIDFGDGTRGTVNYDASTGCTGYTSCTGVASHTYQSVGTYTAILSQLTPGLGACAPGGCSSNQGGRVVTLGTATVTVTGGTTNSTTFTATPTPSPSVNLSASPPSGAAPLTVTFTGVASSSVYDLNFGDGTGTTGQCPQGWCAINVSHTYSSGGTYSAVLQDANNCPSNICGSDRNLASATITVSGSTNLSAADVPTNAAQQIIASALNTENQYLTIENQMLAQKCGDPTTVSNNIALSQHSIQALTLVQTNTATISSPTVQAVGLQQLDQLVASGQLHTAASVSAAQQVLNSCSTASSASDKSANLANALTALQSALKALIGKLGQ